MVQLEVKSECYGYCRGITRIRISSFKIEIFCQWIGLIQSIGRKGLRRQYAPKIINKLNIISLGRIAGLSLNEITTMFNESNQLTIDRNLLAQKASDIDLNIKRLKAIRDSLNHVASCPQSDHLECPSFQKLMKSVKSFES